MKGFLAKLKRNNSEIIERLRQRQFSDSIISLIMRYIWGYDAKFEKFKPMRVVSEVVHPDYKITIFHWNNRYLLKLEAGPFEQTFKVSEFDVTSEEDVKKILSPEFIQQALLRFNAMSESLRQSMETMN